MAKTKKLPKKSRVATPQGRGDLELELSHQYKKDYRRLSKSGKKSILTLLDKTVELLRTRQKLPVRYMDHALEGDWKPARDCHVAPDWVLIYEIRGNCLHLYRTGTHSELLD